MFYADVCAAVSAVTNRLRCVTVSRLGQLVLVGLLMGYQSVRADDATLTAEPDSIVLEDFQGDTGSFPSGWGVRGDEQWPRARKIYRLASDSTTYLQAIHHGDRGIRATQIIKSVTWDVHRYPILRWRWRAHALPPGGDERDGSGTNDCAASLYVIFHVRDLIFVQLFTAVKYTWSTTVPVGTEVEGRWRGHKIGSYRVKVAETGSTNAGKWVTEEVDLWDEHVQLFGDPPRRKCVGIALLTDADATRSLSAADYGPIVVLTREAARAKTDTTRTESGQQAAPQPVAPQESTVSPVDPIRE